MLLVDHTKQNHRGFFGREVRKNHEVHGIHTEVVKPCWEPMTFFWLLVTSPGFQRMSDGSQISTHCLRFSGLAFLFRYVLFFFWYACILSMLGQDFLVHKVCRGPVQYLS